MSPVNLRNLEQIHEASGARSPRLATFLLAATGAAAVLVVGMAMRDRQPTVELEDKDPLAALVADAARDQKDTTLQLRARELDFPSVLSDADAKTTALVAVRDKDGRLLAPEPEEALTPPPATDTLPVVPLPAGSLLAATSVTLEPKDELTQMAAQVSTLPGEGALAAPGSDGAYSIQVASFKRQEDADSFVMELRRRGHSAFRLAANVPGRGIWHRVRIGSFTTKFQAELYKKKLEQTERTIALVIDPEKVERQEDIRSVKLAERIRKYGSE
jgi:cell division septation protein DedD